MKYPLDPTTFMETVNSLVINQQTQDAVVQKMAELLENAMDASDSEDEWYKETETLLKDLHALKMWHESRRFNEANTKAQLPKESGPTLNALSGPPDSFDDSGSVEMSEAELEKHFNEKRDKKKTKEKEKSLSQMSLEEIESWEKTQENATDLYKIKARVANLARGGNMNLTPTGEILCNTYVHVLKAFYDFADKLEDKNVKTQLTILIRSQEGLPGTIIAAAGAGVKEKKDEKGKL
jgi:hypothetical protein